jgi:hypothetical protein
MEVKIMLNKKIGSLVASVIIFVFAVIFTQSLMAQSRVVDLVIPLQDGRNISDSEKQHSWNVNTDTKGNSIAGPDQYHNPEKYNSLAIDFGVQDTKNSGRLEALQIEIVAANEGVVKITPHLDGRGDEIKITSNDGSFTTTYMHTVANKELNGKEIKAGDIIGRLAGASDLSLMGNLTKDPSCKPKQCDIYWTGPHLHFNVKIDNNTNIDFSLEGVSIRNITVGQKILDKPTLSPTVASPKVNLLLPGFSTNLPNVTSEVSNMPYSTPSSLGIKESSGNACVAPTQTTKAVDENPPFTSQGNYWGHMSCMLTKSGTLEDVYSTLGPTYFAASGTRVPSYNSSRVMTVNGISSPPQITALETSTGAVTVGIPVSIDMHELGSNSYMSWGYWLQNSTMQAGGTNYTVNNRGYYLRGDPTTNAQMNDLIAHNVSGTYSGTANGTYWTNTGGANMAGSFNANVNFASRSLNNINMSISGGGHSASISGATATASGSSSTFIGNANGQWKIDGATLGSSSTKDLRGVVLGPTGKAVGGGFGMGQSPATTGLVIGIFQGTR